MATGLLWKAVRAGSLGLLIALGGPSLHPAMPAEAPGGQALGLDAVIAAASAESSAPPLLPGSADWGKPPAKNEPHELVQPPPYDGWWRNLGSGGSPLLAARGNVLLEDDTSISLLDSASGEIRWRREMGDYWRSGSILLGEHAIYYMEANQTHALSLADGSPLWVNPRWMTVALAPDGLWATRPLEQEQGESWYEDIALLDAATGVEKQLYAVGPLTCIDPSSAVYSATGLVPSLPVKTKDGLMLLHTDGSIQGLSSARRDWPGRMMANDHWLLALEYAAVSAWTDDAEEDYEAAYAKARLDPATGKPGPAAFITLYALPEGDVAWRMPSDDEDFQFASAIPEFNERYAVIPQTLGVMVMRMADQAIVYQSRKIEGASGPFNCILSGGNLYLAELDEQLSPGPFMRIDLDNGRRDNLFSTGFALEPVAVDGGTLLATHATGGYESGYSSETSLAGLRLDDTGLPYPGTLRVFNPPDEFGPLRERFFASPAPLADQALMRDLVGGGYDAFLRLLDAAGPSDTAQLSALAAAAAYMDKKSAASEESHYSAALLLSQHLRSSPNPAYTPLILRWLADPTLASLHDELRGALAFTDGPDASHYLANAFGMGAATHSTPPPPYLVKPHASFPTGFGPGQTEVGISELKAAGTRYALFHSDGLQTGADVYLGVDADNDGAFEQVLATGLLHYFDAQLDRSGDRYEPVLKNALRLVAVDGDSIAVEYTGAKVGGDDEEPNWSNTEGEPAKATLSLAALRKDSDGDGLTDQLELLLMLDPQRADTDGDSIPDRDDPAPNVSAASMGKLERGVARALDYFFNSEKGDHTGWWQDDTGLPCGARYIYLRGAGPVAFSGSPSTYGICVVNQENAYENRAPAYVAGDSFVSAELHSAGEPGAMYGTSPPGVTHVLELSFHGVGYAVNLVELDGELYPVQTFMTWIA